MVWYQYTDRILRWDMANLQAAGEVMHSNYRNLFSAPLVTLTLPDVTR